MRPVTPGRIRELYGEHFTDPRRERLFLSSVGFFGAFATARAVTHAIRNGIPPFHNLDVSGRHLHHLVPGIFGLLGTGYLWLLQYGTGLDGGHRSSRATAVLYGVGSALTLDEFALWLNLRDVYWLREGRESVDAAMLFGALLSMSFWGRPFLRAVLREVRAP